MTIRGNMIIIASLSAMAAMPAAAQQGQPTPATPATPAARWVVNTDGPTCSASRPLAGTPSADFALRSFPGSGSYELILLADSLPRSLRNQQNVRLALQPGTAVYQRAAVGQVTTPQGTRQAIRFTLPEDFLRNFGAATSLVLRSNDDAVLTYPLPRAAGVASVFGDCERMKLVDWGADPAGLAPGARRARPVGDLRTWLGGQEIPRPSGPGPLTLAYRLTLGADGRPTQCTIIETSLDERTRAAICPALMTNARFEPARDASGNAVRASVTQRFSVGPQQ